MTTSMTPNPHREAGAVLPITERGREAIRAITEMPVGDRSPKFLINRKEALTIVESYRRDVERLTRALLAKLEAGEDAQ